jgi:hypothetical protein
LAFAAAALAGTSPASAGQDSDGLKAALVFNILRFVDFAGGGAGGKLRLCLPRDVEGRSALAALDGRSSGHRAIEVRTTAPGSAQGCDAIYLGAASAGEISQVRRDGLLVIGDGSGFIGAGGTIGLVRMGNQVRFEVNNRSARQAHISISSKLLRLAARIEQ